MFVVLGATGAIGSHVVETLDAAGREVRTVTRADADLTDRAQVRRAVAGADVVIHAAQPPYTRWAQEFPQLTTTIADAVADVGARLVFADNLYVYGPVDGPLHEDLPASATDAKGRVRARMAADLLARTDLDVVIGRASDYLGPRGTASVAGTTLFGNVARGRPAQVTGSADQPHTWHHLPDVARALVRLADAPHAGGRIWHLPAAPPVTARELVHLADPDARVSVLPGPLHRVLALGHPVLRELWGTRYQFTAPFVVDDSRFRAEIGGVEPTPLAAAATGTLNWFRHRGPQLA